MYKQTQTNKNNRIVKKILYLATAILALAACSKSEILNPSNAPINFSPNALATKALILPDGNAGTTESFPSSETFNVFAFADLGKGNGTNYGTPLMNDVEISNQNGDWKATTGTYVWPNSGTVDFYAYHPGSLNAVFDSTATPKGLAFTGISLGTSVGSQIDPLVASTLGQVSTNRPTVGLVFKHITSQIAVTAYDATTTKSLRGKISIEKVVFKNMKTSGDYTEGTTVGKGAWSNINTNADFTSFSGKIVLDTLENYLSAGQFSSAIDNSAAFVVVPEGIIAEDLTNNTHQAIEVSYSIAAYTINDFDYPATPTQTVTIPLYNRVSANTFQNGKRYVFHLGISLDGANNEIMFNPQVEGWETEDITGLVIDAVNKKMM